MSIKFFSTFVLTTAMLAAWATNASAATILYTAEGDSSSASDSALGDGAQNGVFQSGNVTVSSSNPRFGTDAFNFVAGNSSLDTIDIPGTTNLGSAFTLAAFVDTTGTGLQRLFSSFDGVFAPADRLLLDFSPTAILTSPPFKVRAVIGGVNVNANPASLSSGYFHLAATYDDGVVRLYLDGFQVATGGTSGAGAVTLLQNLRIGEDYDPTNTDNEQLVGDVDDILVWNTALSASQILDIATNGADQFVNPIPEPMSLALVGIGLIGLLGSRRRQKSC